jgi:uncharacterized protein (DUF1499 family)
MVRCRTACARSLNIMTLPTYALGFVAVTFGLALDPGRSAHAIEGTLPPCPSTPNCVSSEADASDAIHHLPPLSLPDGLDPVAALDDFEAYVRSRPRATVLARSPLRLQAIDRTLVFRFVDDVEARVDPVTRRLHLRSASRIGGADGGTNRRRATAWLAAQARAWAVPWPEPR